MLWRDRNMDDKLLPWNVGDVGENDYNEMWFDPTCAENVEVMPVSEHERRSREMDASYDMMASRWRDDVEFVHSKLRALAATEGVEGTLIEVELKLVLHMLGDPEKPRSK